MSETLKPELAKNSKFWIERHRYYELKHFCLQYRGWREALLSFDSLDKAHIDPAHVMSRSQGSPTERCAIARAFYRDRMNMVADCAAETDRDLGVYILIGVTQGLKYEHLRTVLDIPCSRNEYYERYREFFWRLDKIRE